MVADLIGQLADNLLCNKLRGPSGMHAPPVSWGQAQSSSPTTRPFVGYAALVLSSLLLVVVTSTV